MTIERLTGDSQPAAIGAWACRQLRRRRGGAAVRRITSSWASAGHEQNARLGRSGPPRRAAKLPALRARVSSRLAPLSRFLPRAAIVCLRVVVFPIAREVAGFLFSLLLVRSQAIKLRFIPRELGSLIPPEIVVLGEESRGSVPTSLSGCRRRWPLCRTAPPSP